MLAAEAQATGFPALLIIFGILGLIISAGIAIGGRRATAKKLALVCLASVVLGVVFANFD